MITTGTSCLINRLGTGGEPCQVNEGVSTGFILVPKGWQLSKASGTFNKEYVDEQIQNGTFIPFTNAFGSAPTTPEPTTEESNLGITSVARQGLPMYVFTYKRGYAFHKSAYSYNSNGEYDFLITYSEEVIKAAETPDGLFIKGFSGGMLNTAGYAENTGSVSAQTSTSFQLTSSKEYNQYGVFLTDLDFLPSSLNGRINVTMTGRADVSEGKVYVKAAWSNNEQYNYSMFQAANFQLEIDGVVDPISGATPYNVSTKEFAITPTITPLTTTMNIVARLFDSVTDLPVTVAIGNKFYVGETPVFQPVA